MLQGPVIPIQSESELVPEVRTNARAVALAGVLAAREEIKAYEEQKRIKESNGVLFYRPHWKQHLFHVSPAKGRYLRTGNRFGKSDCGAAETVAMAIGGRLWYKYDQNILDGDGNIKVVHKGNPNHPLIRQGIPQRGLKILVIVTDWEMARRVFTNVTGDYNLRGKIWKMLPTSMVGKIEKGGKGDRIEVIEVLRPEEFGGGSSTITFATIEAWKKNELKGESVDWDVIHVDEPIPQLMWEGYSRGLMDRDGKYYFTCTPLNEMWINDTFTPKGEQLIMDAPEGRSFLRKFMITGSTHDNPYRNKDGVEDFEGEIKTEEDRLCRIYGYPKAYSGLVYKEFQNEEHVLQAVPSGWTSMESPPLDYTIRCAWDVHLRIPQAILCVATAPSGRIFFYREQFNNSMIHPNADSLKKHLDGRHVMDLIIDPFAVTPDPVDDTSILDVLAESHNLWFDKASKDLQTGISAVRELLLKRDENGKPYVYFSPNCTELLWEFGHYLYDTKKNRPVDADDHMMENLYRLVLNGLDYVKPTDDTQFVSRQLVIYGDEDLRGSRRNPSLS